MSLGAPELIILLVMGLVLVVPIVLVVVLVTRRRPSVPPAPVGPAVAGWYPDPIVRGRQRYFDGNGWTDHIT